MDTDRFEEHVHLPLIAVPDWGLARRIEELFREHSLISTELHVEATDTRGTYERGTVDELERAAEARNEGPHTIRIYVTGVEGDGRTPRFLNAYQSLKIGSGGRLIAGDEQLVHHLKTRIEELFTGASPREVPGVRFSEALSAAESPRVARAFRAVLDHPIPAGIISTVVGGLILALLVLWLTGSDSSPSSPSPTTATEPSRPTNSTQSRSTSVPTTTTPPPRSTSRTELTAVNQNSSTEVFGGALQISVSSIGFGGGSSYIADFSLDTPDTRSPEEFQHKKVGFVIAYRGFRVRVDTISYGGGQVAFSVTRLR